MNKLLGGRTLLCVVACMLFLAGWLAGQEKSATQKTIVHAAAWTARDGLSQQDLDNFRAETAALVGKVPGLRRAWVGKLRQPATFDGVKRDGPRSTRG